MATGCGGYINVTATGTHTSNSACFKTGYDVYSFIFSKNVRARNGLDILDKYKSRKT